MSASVRRSRVLAGVGAAAVLTAGLLATSAVASAQAAPVAAHRVATAADDHGSHARGHDDAKPDDHGKRAGRGHDDVQRDDRRAHGRGRDDAGADDRRG